MGIKKPNILYKLTPELGGLPMATDARQIEPSNSAGFRGSPATGDRRSMFRWKDIALIYRKQ